MLPSRQEIKAVVFAINQESAPSPDGFGAFFYQTYWDIIKDDVVKVVLEFFTSFGSCQGSTQILLLFFPRFQMLTPQNTTDLLQWQILNSRSYLRLLQIGLLQSCPQSFLKNKWDSYIKGTSEIACVLLLKIQTNCTTKILGEIQL